MTLKPFVVDLHLHTVLSPCGELEMGAPEIVSRAVEQGIDLLAVTDHNSCLNYPALAGAAEGQPIRIIPGMEIQSAEDVHVVALFGDYGSALVCQEWVWDTLPDVPNREDVFGYQVVIDRDNGVVDMVSRLLIQGTDRSVDRVVDRVHELRGVAILAHVDRPAFSYPAVLGFVPKSLPVDGLELSPRVTTDEIGLWRESYPDRTFLRSSDSHRLEEISKDRCSLMFLEEPTFDEVALALRGEGGRSVII
ncbi:PHP domain-containing protein [Dethiosulfovibrio sp. F2B]|uniref:PHP domain-containing protein n=1 Tax=Dethiosulfovibrio faecalis TaxID=2720018 RepID=UPI001F3DC09B|nr:PHP domain-containing protein [Dethiosulfovibrio faecalis]MCF4151631.1 PHP domain-containing protein [Dethiosulfovibrio faecalis]